MDIEIGKFTLESLTTGMYSEPESCYREYIQNSVDAIDEAISAGIMAIDESRIEIIVDSDHSIITVKDNGVGLSKDVAQKTLLDIGNSSKRHTLNRGFRGIGRLGGLSYCKKLSFCTTASGDDTKTIVTFDCVKLKSLLISEEKENYNLQKVIMNVTNVEILPEQKSAHYFIVKMDGVDDISSLLDYEIVKDYISQVAPIPFHSHFYWRSQIKEEFSKVGFKISEYPIFLGTSFENLTQLFKPYRGTLEANPRSGELKDEIENLSFFNIPDENSGLMAIGWYANTSFFGTLIDECISGIRIRQGNILIGNAKTISEFFKEPRFNNWVLGEIYIISQNLIPNARRDNFEKNDTYSLFGQEFLSTVGTEIPSKIRLASKTRNNPSQKTIDKAKKTIVKVQKVLDAGFNSSYEKEEIASLISNTQKNLYSIPKNSSEKILEEKLKVADELKSVATIVEESNNYKAKQNTTADFSKSERKIIRIMLEVLTRNFERETVDSLYKEFLDEMKNGGHK